MSVFYKLQKIDALLSERHCISRLHSPAYLFHSLKNREQDYEEGLNLGIEIHSLGERIDKIFSTRWISESTVLLGTKCGKLFQSNSMANSEIITTNSIDKPLPIRFIIDCGQEIVCSSRKKGNCISLFDCSQQNSATEIRYLKDLEVCQRGLISSSIYQDEYLLVATKDGNIYQGKRNEGQFCFSSFATVKEGIRKLVPFSNRNSLFLLNDYSQLMSIDLVTKSTQKYRDYSEDYCSDLNCIATNESRLFIGSKSGISMLDLRASTATLPIWTAKNCPTFDPLHRIMGPVSMIATGEYHLTVGLASGQVMLFEERMNNFSSVLIDFSLLYNFASVFSLDYAHSFGTLVAAGGTHYKEFFGNFFAFIQ